MIEWHEGDAQDTMIEGGGPSTSTTEVAGSTSNSESVHMPSNGTSRMRHATMLDVHGALSSSWVREKQIIAKVEIERTVVSATFPSMC